MEEATQIAVAAIGSGALGSYVTHLLRRSASQEGREHAERDRRLADTANLVTELMARIDTRDQIIAELQQTGMKAAAEVADLRERLATLHVSPVPENGAGLLAGWLDSLPWPSWVHAVGRNAWHLNVAYCDRWGVPRTSFWSPVNILAAWPIEQAADWVREDLEVVEGGMPRQFWNDIPRDILRPPAADNPTDRVFVVKRPWVIDDRKYILGTAWLEDMSDDLFAALDLIVKKPAAVFQ